MQTQGGSSYAGNGKSWAAGLCDRLPCVDCRKLSESGGTAGLVSYLLRWTKAQLTAAFAATQITVLFTYDMDVLFKVFPYLHPPVFCLSDVTRRRNSITNGVIITHDPFTWQQHWHSNYWKPEVTGDCWPVTNCISFLKHSIVPEKIILSMNCV